MVSRRGALVAGLLIVMAVLVVAGAFLTITETTQRLLDPGATFSDTHSHVSVTTDTAWSTSSPELGAYLSQPLAGWADLVAGAFAVVVAVLLLATGGRRAWARPLATLASGVVVGVILMSVLHFVELMGAAGTTKDMAVETAAGPAVWLQIPAGLIALVIAALALAHVSPASRR